MVYWMQKSSKQRNAIIINIGKNGTKSDEKQLNVTLTPLCLMHTIAKKKQDISLTFLLFENIKLVRSKVDSMSGTQKER